MKAVMITYALISSLSIFVIGCSTEQAEKPPAASKFVEADKKPPSRPSTVLANPITATQQTATKETLAPCWNFDPGLANAKNLKIDVRVFLKPDGSVVRTELVDPSIVKLSPQHRAAAMSALRAPMNPACNKFPLTSDREFSLIISFDPKDMGQ